MKECVNPQDVPAIAGGQPAKTTAFRKEQRYGPAELTELKEALEQGSLFYAHGKKVKQLEAEFAAACGFAHGVATSSGTACIHAALAAAGISPGDEVIVPPITDMGTLLPVLYQGAIPVFADLDPRTYCLAPKSVEQRITDRTRAIIAVHLAGNACDMDALCAIAGRRRIAIVEDCAQAHGTLYRGKAVGKFGLCGCYSFNEFKHISCGDGGVVLTDDAAFANRVRLATDKGYDRGPGAAVRQTSFLANNYRMTELQGAVGRAQVRKLSSIIERRRTWCSALTRRLGGIAGLQLPVATEGAEHSWWFYLMRVDAAKLGATTDEFTAALKAEGLPVGAHYIGQPVYEYPIFAQHKVYDRGAHPSSAVSYGKGLCPTAEAILETCVMLSVNESYSEQDLEETVHAITRVARWYARPAQVTVKREAKTATAAAN